MGAIVTLLPLIIEGLKYAPQLIKGGMEVYEGAKLMWQGATSGEAPTPEQQKQYDDAMEEAFQALMTSTSDVKE